MGVKKEDGIVPMVERLVAADISRYKLVRNNWFAYNPMRLNIGSIARWQGESDVLVSPDYVVFRCLERSMPTTLLPEYFDSFRGSRQWDAFVSEAGDGGVRVRIYYRDIAQLQLALPDVEEQQNIADCLGSLGDLIATEGRKLDALRQHKQGLMQQLFPRPGETVPQLRFPEFEDAPGWRQATIGEFSPFSYGKSLRKDIRNLAGHIPVFGSNGHVGWHDKALTDGPTIIIGRKGTVGAVHYSPVPCWPIDTTFFVSGSDAELVSFKYYALNALGLAAMNTDSAVPGLNRKACQARELRIPPQFEQRVMPTASARWTT